MTDTMKIVWTASLAALLILALDSYRRIRNIETQVTSISGQLDAIPTEGSGEASNTEDETAVDVMPDLMDDAGKE